MNSSSTKISAAPRTRGQKRTAEAEAKRKEEEVAMKQKKPKKFPTRKIQGALPNSGMVTLIGRNDMIQNSKNPLKIKIEEEVDVDLKPEEVGGDESPNYEDGMGCSTGDFRNVIGDGIEVVEDNEFIGGMKTGGQKPNADVEKRGQEKAEMKKQKRTLELNGNEEVQLPMLKNSVDITKGLEEEEEFQASFLDQVACSKCQNLEKLGAEKDLRMEDLEQKLDKSCTEKDQKIKELEQELESLKQKLHHDSLSKLVQEMDKVKDSETGGEPMNKSKPIFVAILEGKSKAEIQRLVERGEEWDVPNADGDTVLHVAAKAGSLELIEYFISISDDPDVNAKNSSGRTPVMEVAKSGKNFFQVFDILVKNGADLYIEDCENYNVLDISFTAGRSVKEIEKILRSTPNWSFDDPETYGGHMVLHVITKSGNLEALKFFLSLGLNVNARSNIDETPLMTATFSKQNFLPMVFLLLKNGADITFRNRKGYDVIYYAIKNQRTSADLEFLATAGALWNIRRTRGKKILHVCAEHDNVEAIKYFIGKGEDLNAADKYGATPVMDAAQRGNFRSMNFLIENGADFEASQLLDLVCKKDMMVGKKPLFETIKSLSEHGAILNGDRLLNCFHTFVEHGNLEAVRYFIMNGADVNGRDSDGRTPLMNAILGDWKPKLNVFDFLMEVGADIHVVDSNGFDLLHLATCSSEFRLGRGKSLEIIEKLIQHGATWSNTEPHQESILHAAVRGGRPEVVQYFITNGVDVNAKNEQGDTPLLHAVRINVHNLEGILRVLVNGGADPNAVDEEGYTALLLGTEVMVEEEECGGSKLKLSTLKLLVALGCDSRIPNKEGETVLSMLKDHGKFHLLKYFKSPV